MADDDVSLRADTLAILRQFMAEQEAAKKREAEEADDKAQKLKLGEDWQMSQFWYDEPTCVALASEILRLASECAERKRAKALSAASSATAGSSVDSASSAPPHVRVACLACPSAFKALVAKPLPEGVEPFVLEFDKRFAVFGDRFVHYDFNRPTDSIERKDLFGSIDVIALDPPFLNPDCLAGFTQTIEALRANADVPILLCTGAVMLPHARRLLRARPTNFHVGHSNQLSNPFALYTNYEPPAALGGYDLEAEAAAAADLAALVTTEVAADASGSSGTDAREPTGSAARAGAATTT